MKKEDKVKKASLEKVLRDYLRERPDSIFSNVVLKDDNGNEIKVSKDDDNNIH